ncbi:Na/K ATPase alpha 1 subunit [Eremomyces bilateralis CBS 781.70]|uniref:Na/K ATPase alpha 1 subunit n=1 Tax=Eremomyces bilateralis CBS 781.70 TaxID=1392243 RepID=A0A6G1FSA8_9PEZI|nr:Na/K ATPase alpha 1 subunit [Eremomyces bilateralis CBS 781.70]KAF1808571.1 Na/K ATPase alpha 1 subunit [Eremomyces bilateralis CBS 781.70]
MSIRSFPRHRTVDPNIALPIEYRTVSFNIAETQERQPEKTPKDKEGDVEHEIALLEWHILPVEDVLSRLSVSAKQGLSTDQVARKQSEFGPNSLTPPPSRWFIKTLGYLYGGFGSVLFVAAILVFIAWKPLGQPPAIANLALAIVLAVVWVIQAGFAFYQDWSSSRVMSSILTMLPDDCIVLRDGTKVEVSATQLVPGDILYVRIGDKLPADVRFLEASPDAKFDRSILTGETLPMRAAVDSNENNYLETPCIGMAGTHCVSGHAVAVIVSTGDRSVFGRLAKLTSTPDTGFTLLEKEICYFVAAIVSIMITMVLISVTIWAAWLRKDHPEWISVSLLIVSCVSIAVAFIPEGLPIAVSASLTITANIMRKNKILCKSLKTVETLGSVSVICSDKTGTLTKNQMTTSDCLVSSEAMTANAAIGALELGQKDEYASQISRVLEEIAEIGALCNAGEFDASTINLPAEQRKVHGDATDSAILRFSEALIPVSQTREKWQRLYRLAFNSRNKFMIQVISLANQTAPEKTAEGFLTVKGAPDILLPRCLFYLDNNGSTKPMTETHRAHVGSLKDNWSGQGKRVILLACKKLPSTTMAISMETSEFEDSIMDESKGGLELVGLIAIVDPPKDEIPDVVSTLRGAGIKVHMVTGDFKLTAVAIARDCGIITVPKDSIDDAGALSLYKAADVIRKEPRAIAINGRDMQALDYSQWEQLCGYDEIVFARTTPEQKLRIVKELQARGAIVGMTGDGVNDAPSLKTADIGIAMGNGSDIAIEAADMVLLDSFAAIIEAVKYGRVVFDNLKKTICFLLPAGSFSEFTPVITNIAFGLPQILSSFLMIIICCCTDCAAATAIAYEKPEADVLLQKPRNPKKDHLVTWRLVLQAYGSTGMLMTVSSFTMSYWYAERNGVPFSVLWFGFGKTPDGMSTETMVGVLNIASSIYFLNLVIMQWFNLMAVRTRRLSILQHPPLFRKETRNLYLFPAIIFALLVAVLFLYVPRIQTVLATTAVPVAHWFLPMGFGMGLLLLDEGRKYCVRNFPKSIIARIAW